MPDSSSHSVAISVSSEPMPWRWLAGCDGEHRDLADEAARVDDGGRDEPGNAAVLVRHPGAHAVARQGLAHLALLVVAPVLAVQQRVQLGAELGPDRPIDRLPGAQRELDDRLVVALVSVADRTGRHEGTLAPGLGW